MVIFDLECDNAHAFEAWFKNQADLEQQKERGLLLCPICASQNVNKKISVPKLHRKSTTSSIASEKKLLEKGAATSLSEYRAFQSALKQVHDYIDTNYTDVGSHFVDEVMSMQRGEKEKENIRGTASKEGIKQLAQAGVDAVPLPPKPIDKKKLN